MINFTKAELLVLKFLIEQAPAAILPENAFDPLASAHDAILIALQNINDREDCVCRH